MKKVLMVTRPIAPPWDEASKNFAYNLATGITKFKMTMLTPGQVDSLDPKIEQLAVYNNAHLSVTQKIRLFGLYTRRKHYDIVHFLLTPNKSNSRATKLIFGKNNAKTVQTIVTLRDDIYDEATIRKILFGDVLVTYSDYAKRKLKAMGYKNVSRIYPGIDFDYYKPASKNPGMLKEYGIDKSDFVVSYPGEYVRLGVTDQLVELLPDMIKKVPNLKFVFACRIKNDADAQKKASVQRHFQKLGLGDHIVYTDTVSDMAKLYNLSDIVLFPVKDMTGKFDVPLSIIEAMACGKPVVVTDLPVLAEFTESNNSVVIPHDKLSQLNDEIFRLYDEPSTRTRIGENARKYVLSNFDIKKSRQAYEKIYEELLEKS